VNLFHPKLAIRPSYYLRIRLQTNAKAPLNVSWNVHHRVTPTAATAAASRDVWTNPDPHGVPGPPPGRGRRLRWWDSVSRHPSAAAVHPSVRPGQRLLHQQRPSRDRGDSYPNATNHSKPSHVGAWGPTPTAPTATPDFESASTKCHGSSEQQRRHLITAPAVLHPAQQSDHSSILGPKRNALEG
jgi:hypothetical protein